MRPASPNRHDPGDRRARDARSARRLPAGLRRVALACAVLAGALLGAAPASALSQRGHDYSFSFAGGSGEVPLADPGALAVDEASGDVYVSDRANNRIERFSSSGQFIAAWGWGVGAEPEGKKYEVCTSGCKAGLAGTHKDQFDASLLAIAVDDCRNLGGETCSRSEDPSVGDVYVAAQFDNSGGEEYEAIDKFTPEGQPVEQVHLIKYLEEAGEKKGEAEEVELEPEQTHGLTVGPDGTVWLYYEEDLYGLSDAKLSEATVQQKPLEFPGLEGEPAPGLATDARLGTDTHGEFYLAQAFPAGEGTREVISKWRLIDNQAHEPELQELSQEVDGADTSALALDAQRSDVYLDNLTSVSSFGPSGSLIESFGSEPSEPDALEHLKAGSGLAVDSATKTVYVADSSADHIDVFAPEAPAAPTIEDVSAQDVTSNTLAEEVQVKAQLDATIDPRGTTTDYRFQYGTAPCASSPSACTEVPGGEIPQSFGEEGFGEARVSVQLGHATSFPLLPATLYHYRAIASNEAGGKLNETLSVQEGTFSTPPASGPFIADQRDWELVSPPDKDGASVEYTRVFGGLVQASADGNALTYIANGPFAEPEGSRSLEPAQILSTRDQAGVWSSKDIVTPNSAGTGIHTEPKEYEFFSPNLALALLQPYIGGSSLAEPPLAPPASPSEAGHQEKTPYLRADAPLSPQAPETPDYLTASHNGEVMNSPGYLPLLTAASLPGVSFGGERDVRFAAATADLTHVVLASMVPLGSPAPPGGGYGLYEWSGGSFAPVGVLPGGTLAEEAQLGSGFAKFAENGAGENLRHVISDDGSRVFWSANGHLYMRDTASDQTVQLDAAQGTTEPEQGLAQFQTASADGSKAFFTDKQRLTPDSTAEPGQGEEGKADLYECEMVEELVEGKSKLACRLKDLTVDRNEGEHAAVQGLLLGASEDGSYVYFLANGVLSAASNPQGQQATPGDCTEGLENAPRQTCNLYVEHFDSQSGHQESGQPQFIAALSGADARAWQGVTGTDLGETTARVSPNGRFLAFMSQLRLTGYDNRATAPAAADAPAQEVYEYAAPTPVEEEHSEPGRLVCASCDPSGARPVGLLDPSSLTGEQDQEGLGLLSDPLGVWAGTWLAGELPTWTGFNQDASQALYQSRYLSDSGRLFFDSPEALVPEDVNGRQDVYEYEPEGVPRGRHQCTSSAETFAPRSDGCIGLVSSGTSASESVFLDASESGGEGPAGEQLSEGGGDVFLLTAARLAPQDTDEAFDAYDAHECTAAQPCASGTTVQAPSPGETTSSCRAFSYSSPRGSTPAPPSTSGNLTQAHAGVQHLKSVKKLTPAQQLAKALAACRRLKKHSQRVACETRARSRYRAAQLAQALAACKRRNTARLRAACDRRARARYARPNRTKRRASRARSSQSGSASRR